MMKKSKCLGCNKIITEIDMLEDLTDEVDLYINSGAYCEDCYIEIYDKFKNLETKLDNIRQELK